MRGSWKISLFVGAVSLIIWACGGGKDGDVTTSVQKATETVVGLIDGATEAVAAEDAASSAEAEKAKAMANPYANDLGPNELAPDVLAAYPKEHQDAYKNILLVKCAKCHTPSRPLNSQFFEPAGKKEEKAAKLTALKKSDPDIFKEKNIWHVEGDIWQRYVKRMMAKPGCGITQDEGKKVWAFLVYDSNQRKIGKNKAAWKAHRTKLLADFKAQYPARYKELYETAAK